MILGYLDVATSLVKLATAIAKYAERKSYIRHGQMEAFEDAMVELNDQRKAVRKSRDRLLSDPEYAERLRGKRWSRR